jgi:hypothetical protein
MVRSVFGKVMWVGRATVFLVGLAVILALVFGVAATSPAAVPGDPFKLGKINTVDRVSTLVNEGIGPGLSLQVNSGAPMKVNSTTRVAKPNADMVDGTHVSQLAPRGYAQVTTSDPFIAAGSSKGVSDVDRTSPGNVYCFQLSFEPKAVVASAHINNNATVGTVVGNDVDSKCGAVGDYEAAAVTYAANTDPSPARNDINFGIVFM